MCAEGEVTLRLGYPTEALRTALTAVSIRGEVQRMEARGVVYTYHLRAREDAPLFFTHGDAGWGRYAHLPGEPCSWCSAPAHRGREDE